MKAARIHHFGPPDVIEVEDIPRPSPATGEVLVRVAAAGVAWRDEPSVCWRECRVCRCVRTHDRAEATAPKQCRSRVGPGRGGHGVAEAPLWLGEPGACSTTR